jgi:hypothetical protein
MVFRNFCPALDNFGMLACASAYSRNRQGRAKIHCQTGAGRRFFAADPSRSQALSIGDIAADPLRSFSETWNSIVLHGVPRRFEAGLVEALSPFFQTSVSGDEPKGLRARSSIWANS